MKEVNKFCSTPVEEKILTRSILLSIAKTTPGGLTNFSIKRNRSTFLSMGMVCTGIIVLTWMALH